MANWEVQGMDVDPRAPDWYQLREMYLDTLNRNFTNMNQREWFEALTLSQLRIRNGMFHDQFKAFETAHRRYAQTSRMVTEIVFDQTEETFINTIVEPHAPITINIYVSM